jgi:hypothetical protein
MGRAGHQTEKGNAVATYDVLTLVAKRWAQG